MKRDHRTSHAYIQCMTSPKSPLRWGRSCNRRPRLSLNPPRSPPLPAPFLSIPLSIASSTDPHAGSQDRSASGSAGRRFSRQTSTCSVTPRPIAPDCQPPQHLPGLSYASDSLIPATRERSDHARTGVPILRPSSLIGPSWATTCDARHRGSGFRACKLATGF